MKKFISLALNIIPFVLGADIKIRKRGTDDACFLATDGRLGSCTSTDAIFTASFDIDTKVCEKNNLNNCISEYGDIDSVSNHPIFKLEDGVLKNTSNGSCIASDGEKLVKMRKNKCKVVMMPLELDIDGYLKIGEQCINPGSRSGLVIKLGTCDDNSKWSMDGDKIKNIKTQNCLTSRTLGARSKIITGDCTTANTWDLSARLPSNNKCLKLPSRGSGLRLSEEGCYEWLNFDDVSVVTTAVPTTAVPSLIEISKNNLVGMVVTNPVYKIEFDLKLTETTGNNGNEFASIFTFGDSFLNQHPYLDAATKSNATMFYLSVSTCLSTGNSTKNAMKGISFTLNEFHSFRIETNANGLQPSLWVDDRLVLTINDAIAGTTCDSENRTLPFYAGNPWKTSSATGVLRNFRYNDEAIESLITSK